MLGQGFEFAACAAWSNQTTRRKGGEIMQRNEKQEMVGELHAKLAKADIAVAVAYKDIDAEATVKLRKTFRDAKVEYKVVKNTLARIAAKGTPAEKLAEQLTGPSALILGYGDVVAPAKLLQDVLKDQGEKMTVKAGVVQGNLVDANGLKALASMPGLPELRGMLVGMIATPATTLVRLLNTPGGQLARVLKAHSEKSEKAA
jgi:large subunit ribosomal protein L10